MISYHIISYHIIFYSIQLYYIILYYIIGEGRGRPARHAEVGEGPRHPSVSVPLQEGWDLLAAARGVALLARSSRGRLGWPGRPALDTLLTGGLLEELLLGALPGPAALAPEGAEPLGAAVSGVAAPRRRSSRGLRRGGAPGGRRGRWAAEAELPGGGAGAEVAGRPAAAPENAQRRGRRNAAQAPQDA